MKLFVLLLSFTLYVQGIAQQHNVANPTINSDSYQSNIKKYKTFKTTARVVAGTGLTMLVIGVAQPAPHYYINNDPTLGLPRRKRHGLRVTRGMFGLGSIILFTLASKYKKKAALALKGESASIYGSAAHQLHFTVLSLKVKL